jgi:hypothetical protein
MIATISVCFIVASILSFCLKTSPSFRVHSYNNQTAMVDGHHRTSIQKFNTEPLKIFWMVSQMD